MYIILKGRDDRLGTNLVLYVSQLIYAIFNKYNIKYNTTKPIQYNDSIFVKTIQNYIDYYNSNITNTDTIEDNFIGEYPYDVTKIISLIVITIKQDIISYIKHNTHLNRTFLDTIKERNYTLPFDPINTIIVHLRLDDVAHRNDYNGEACSNDCRDMINRDIPFAFKDLSNYLQAPISNEKIQAQINKALEKYPERKIIIVTSPNSKHTLPYETLYSDDVDYDLFLLSMAEVIILSRSNFALSCLLFGNHKDGYLPLWDHAVSYGLYTKYDKSNYNYFF